MLGTQSSPTPWRIKNSSWPATEGDWCSCFWSAAADQASQFLAGRPHFLVPSLEGPVHTALVTHYYHVLAALSVDSVRMVQHGLHEETGPESYAQLRASLMASHSHSNYQKVERMIRLPPLGHRKSSMILAEMLEFCPTGELSTTSSAAPSPGDSCPAVGG
jgi:hypothetical protein